MKATAQNCKTNSLDSVAKEWMSPTCNLLTFKKFSCFSNGMNCHQYYTKEEKEVWCFIYLQIFSLDKFNIWKGKNTKCIFGVY